MTTDTLTRALQALERALEDSEDLINSRVEYFGKDYRPPVLQRMRDDLAAGERAAEELRAMLAEPTTAEGLTRWAMCPETETPCSHCPTQRVPCEAAASAPGVPAAHRDAIISRMLAYSDVRRNDPRENRDALRDLLRAELDDFARDVLSASPPPPTEQHDLTIGEQQTLNRALRKSVTFIDEQARQPLTDGWRPIESAKGLMVGHSKERGGWCVYEQTGDDEYAFLAGPFPERGLADAELLRMTAPPIEPAKDAG